MSLTARVLCCVPGRLDELLAGGARFVNNSNRFSDDIEPSYITISPDQTTAYFALQVRRRRRRRTTMTTTTVTTTTTKQTMIVEEEERKEEEEEHGGGRGCYDDSY